jgi:hypothetical protein
VVEFRRNALPKNDPVLPATQADSWRLSHREL